MNLQNTIEGHPYAFFLVCIFLTLTMISLFVAFTSKYYQLKADTSSAQSFTLLRNFFSYVDDLECNVFNKDVDRSDFKEMVEKITGLKISEKESEYLFKMVETNRSTSASEAHERKMSFYCGGHKEFQNNLVKINGSRLSILSDYRDIQSSKENKQFGSKLSVFSESRKEGLDEAKETQEKKLLMVQT